MVDDEGIPVAGRPPKLLYTLADLQKMGLGTADFVRREFIATKRLPARRLGAKKIVIEQADLLTFIRSLPRA